MHDADAALEVLEGGVNVFHYCIVDYRAVWVVDGAVAADEQLGRGGVGFRLVEEVAECRVGLKDVEDPLGWVEAGNLGNVFV